jgi:hypothetical protein
VIFPGNETPAHWKYSGPDSRITLPSEIVTRLYSQVAQATVSLNNSNRYTVPCGTNIQLAMTFGGKDFTVDPRDAITQEGDTCFGTVEISDSNIFRFGNPFLRNVYTYVTFTM